MQLSDRLPAHTVDTLHANFEASERKYLHLTVASCDKEPKPVGSKPYDRSRHGARVVIFRCHFHSFILDLLFQCVSQVGVLRSKRVALSAPQPLLQRLYFGGMRISMLLESFA